jgi:hypothetical protein
VVFDSELGEMAGASSVLDEVAAVGSMLGELAGVGSVLVELVGIGSALEVGVDVGLAMELGVGVASDELRREQPPPMDWLTPSEEVNIGVAVVDEPPIVEMIGPTLAMGLRLRPALGSIVTIVGTVVANPPLPESLEPHPPTVAVTVSVTVTVMVSSDEFR